LLLCDEGAQAFRLDGRYVQVKDRRAFRVLCHLLEASEHQATRKELRALPGCDTDISKVLNNLPPKLRAIVHAPHGQNSFYYLRLDPLPEHRPSRTRAAVGSPVQRKGSSSRRSGGK
jgi:hypothetical protein